MFNKRALAAFALALPLAAQAQILQAQDLQAQVLQDSPGPNLVIEVAGQANGQIVIDLREDVAPKHVAQITALAEKGAYDNVVFHRVIEGFMAQTGDVQYGKQTSGDISRAGMGGSDLGDIPAEFSDLNFDRGIVGMARSSNPNSANSQFFIMFEPGPFLNGQYTVVGRVIEGMDVVDQIKRGSGQNGEVTEPDVMTKVTVESAQAPAAAAPEAPAAQ